MPVSREPALLLGFFLGFALVFTVVTVVAIVMKTRKRKPVVDHRNHEHDFFAATPVATYVIDDQTQKIHACNEAAVALYGFSRDDLLKMSLRDLRGAVPPSSSSSSSSRASSSDLKPGQTRHRHRTGEPLDLQIASRPTLFQGRPMSIIAVHDITEHRSHDEQRHQAEKMEAVGRLAGGVAHDFNNMLSIIFGFSTMLLEELPTTDPSREALEEIQRAAERCADFAKQLLAFSRQTPSATSNVAPIDVRAELMSQRATIEEAVGVGIAVDIDAQTAQLSARIDRPQLAHIIKNLALNARDAMPNGGKLSISIARGSAHTPADRNMVVVRVKDTGRGMDASTKEHVFEPFFTTKEEGKGTGLGLAIVFALVQRYGGRVSVQSELGCGTTFEIRLPECEPERSSAVDSPRINMKAGAETILLVEDEAPLRRLMDRALRRTGYNVLSAMDSDEALAIAAKEGQRIDLVITDVSMPKMSGPQLVEQLVKHRPSIKVLFVSGHSPDMFEEQLSPGAIFLQKPVTPIVLSNTVRLLIGGHTRTISSAA